MGIFSYLTSLQVLALDSNKLENLPVGIFSHLTSLQDLYLDSNKLASLPVGIFSGLTSLRRLFLDASFQQETDRIINELGWDIDIFFDWRFGDWRFGDWRFGRSMVEELIALLT